MCLYLCLFICLFMCLYLCSYLFYSKRKLFQQKTHKKAFNKRHIKMFLFKKKMTKRDFAVIE